MRYHSGIWRKQNSRVRHAVYISTYKFLNHTFRSIVGNMGTRLEFEVAVLGAHVGAAPTCAPKTATSNSNCGPYCPLIRARIPAVDWAGTKARASLAYGYRSAHELSRSQLDAAGRREGEEGEEGEGDIRPGPCISTQAAHVFARVDVLRSPSAGRPAGHQTEPLGS